MKKTLLIVAMAVGLMSFTSPKKTENVANGSLTITIKGIEGDKGQIVFMLFNSDDGFPKEVDKAYMKGTVTSFNTSATYTFKNVPYGSYAVAVFHDEDSDGEVKTNFIGFPKESVGASNMAKMGKPNFKKSTIEVNKESTSLDMVFIM